MKMLTDLAADADDLFTTFESKTPKFDETKKIVTDKIIRVTSPKAFVSPK
jgi:hypothetical protein